MKTLAFQRKPAKSALPQRPTSPYEARIKQLMLRDREIIKSIIELEANGAKDDGRADGDGPNIEQAARALLAIEGEPTVAPRKTINLKSLRRELETVRLAVEMAQRLVSEINSAWAMQVLTERRGDYEQSLRTLVLAIAALGSLEDGRQALLNSFGGYGRCSGLPAANLYIARALVLLKPIVGAALTAGIVTKEELDV
jgi:hypothetical protein